MSLDRAEKILVGFEASQELSTRAKNKVDEMLTLFQTGAGNKGETFADLLNSVSDFYSHGENVEKAYISNQFGSGSKKKLDFWEAINDEHELDKLAKRGELLMA